MKAAILAAGVMLIAAGSARLPAIRDFVGKYPFDRISGRRLIDLPVVQTALEGAVYNETVRTSLGKDGVASPIEYSQGLVYAGSCEPHNCGDHNWAFVVSDVTRKAAVCYHDNDLIEGARWFMGHSVIVKSANDCGGGILSMPPVVTRALQTGAVPQ